MFICSAFQSPRRKGCRGRLGVLRRGGMASSYRLLVVWIWETVFFLSEVFPAERTSRKSAVISPVKTQ